MCNGDFSRVTAGVSRLLPISLREIGVSDGAYVGSLVWLLGVSGGEKLDAGVSMFRPLSGVCRSTGGFQQVDREFQSGLVKAFRRLPAPPLVDVSGDSFAKVVAGLPVPNLPNRMPL